MEVHDARLTYLSNSLATFIQTAVNTISSSCRLLSLTATEVVTPVKSQCKIAKNDKD